MIGFLLYYYIIKLLFLKKLPLKLIDSLVKSEWNWIFALLLKKYITFFSAPDSHPLLGEGQTYRTENALPKTL